MSRMTLGERAAQTVRVRKLLKDVGDAERAAAKKAAEAEAKALRQRIHASREAAQVRQPSEQLQRVRASMGRSADTALGDEIPRPKPGPAEQPARFGAEGVTLGGWSGLPPVTPERIEELGNKLRTYGQQALSIEENLELIRAGADPTLLAAGPPDAVTVERILRKVEADGLESLTEPEFLALRRAQASQSQVSPDVLTPDDNLANSAVPLGDDPELVPTVKSVVVPGLLPNKQSVDPITNLAERIRRVITDADTEPVAGLRSLVNEVDGLSDADKLALIQHPELAAGIQSIGARTPEGRAAAIANAEQALIKLHQLAEQDATGRAAEQLASAKAARDAAATPPAGRPERAASAADALAARQLVAETLPKGDVAALMEAFNAMSPERKAEVLSRLPGGQEIVPRGAGEAAVVGKDGSTGMAMDVRLGSVDPGAPRQVISRLLDGSTGEPSFLPNAASQFMPAGSPLEQAILELDDAIRSGDKQAVEMARLNVQTTPAAPEETQTAQRWFAQRQAAVDALRRAIIGTDPMVVDEQARMLANAVSPAPRPNITPTARSPIVQPAEVPAEQMPTAESLADALDRDRAEMIDKRAAGGFLPKDKRLEAFPPKTLKDGTVRDAELKDLPAALRGADRNDPFESRPIGSRLSDTNDAAAIEQAQELEAAIAESDAELRQAMYELRLAQIGRTSGRRASTAADVEAAQQRVAQAQDRARAVRSMEDTLFPPRRVNERTGRVESISKADAADDNVPKGWVVERGRKAWSPGQINKPGAQETIDSLLITGAGGRPKALRNLNRSSDTLSAADNATQAEELVVAFGDDVYEFLPHGGAEDLPSLGKGGKRGRLGGGSQRGSREQGAIWSLYSDRNTGQLVNPLALKDQNGNALFADSRAAAKDLLGRSTVFKPGTPSYEMALDRWTRNIEDFFGGGKASNVPANPSIKAMDAAAPGSPAGDIREGTSLDVDALPALPGRQNAIDIAQDPKDPSTYQQRMADWERRRDLAVKQLATEPLDSDAPLPYVPGKPQQRRDLSSPATPERDADLASFPTRGQRDTAVPDDDAGVSANLNASSFPITPAGSNLPVTPPTSTPSAGAATPDATPRYRRPSPEDIKNELAQYEQDVRDSWSNSGLDKREIDAEVRKAVDARRKELEAEIGTGSVGDMPEPGGSTPSGRADGSSVPLNDTTGSGVDAADGAGPAAAKKKKKPKQPKPTPDSTTTTVDQPAPTPTPSPPPGFLRRLLRRWPLIVGGSAVGFGVNTALNSMGRRVDMSGLGGDAAGGGGGPGVDGGGGFAGGSPSDLPVAVLTSSSAAPAADDPVAQQEAIQRALDRIRGSRAPSDSPPYQTIQNYNIWR